MYEINKEFRSIQKLESETWKNVSFLYLSIISRKESLYERPKRLSLCLVYTRQRQSAVTLIRFSPLAANDAQVFVAAQITYLLERLGLCNRKMSHHIIL
jgi:hypothetical protein